ncbi:MAG: hypothetical protein GX221_10460 [Candidatus Riflebacteria bacterium]|nr:hypothetical protein [Candidatus Riflebacteria bacterium]
MTKSFIFPRILLVFFLTFITASLFAQTTVRSGDMVITGRLMTFYKGIYVARGGVEAVQQDRKMTADKGIYDQNLEIIKAMDNVKVEMPDTSMTADYMEVYVKEERVSARGNPRVIKIMERGSTSTEDAQQSKKTRVILTCDEIEGFNREDRFLAKGRVKVVEVNYREGETPEEALENEKKPLTLITSEIMEAYAEENKMVAKNNVEIITETLKATGDRAVYLNDENRIIITGHAHAIQATKEQGKTSQTSEVFANKIIYYIDSDRTIAVGNVKATVYPGSTKN